MGDKNGKLPKYIKRQNLTRLLSLYEIFKLVVDVKGSIIECGVNRGFGLMSWAKFSSIIEPINLTREYMDLILLKVSRVSIQKINLRILIM